MHLSMYNFSHERFQNYICFYLRGISPSVSLFRILYNNDYSNLDIIQWNWVQFYFVLDFTPTDIFCAWQVPAVTFALFNFLRQNHYHWYTQTFNNNVYIIFVKCNLWNLSTVRSHSSRIVQIFEESYIICDRPTHVNRMTFFLT